MLARALMIFTITATSLFGTPQELVAPMHGETMQQFGARIIPKGAKMLHPVVHGNLGPGTTSIAVFFRGEQETGFRGWILMPENGAYRKLVLPEHESPASAEIKAAFFRVVGDDKQREMFVLCEHVSGVGHYPGSITPFYTTYVFRVDGKRTEEDEALESQLDPAGQLRTAGQVIGRLRALGY
jgi:hypothetical protein